MYRFVMNKLGKIATRIFLFGFGFNWIVTRGQPAPTKEAPVMVVSPHSSLLDMFIISLYKVPTYVARADLRDIPVFGSETECVSVCVCVCNSSYTVACTILYNVP